MRTATAFFVVVAVATQAWADFKQGDIVVVVKESQLRSNNQNVGTVQPGFSLSIQKIERDWLWVSDGTPGWLKASNVVPLDEADGYFTEAIRKEPRNSRHFAARAMVWTEKKDYGKAIEDYSQAIRLNPNERIYYGLRGWTHLRQNDFNRALDDCSKAIVYGLATSTNYNNRGWAYAGKHDYARAIGDFTTAMRLDPRLAYPVENLAEIYACCPEDRWRDGKKAVTLAKKVCEMSRWLQPSHLHLLAAASAENGQFDEAVRWEEKAIELNPPAKQSNRQAFEKALSLFKDHQPFHEIVSIE